MCEELDAVLARKHAARGLSLACLERLHVPGSVSPLVELYEDYMLQQDEMEDAIILLAKVK